MELEELLKQYEGWIKLAVSLITGIAAIYGCVRKPVKEMRADVDGFKAEMKGQIMDVRETTGNVRDMTDFLTGDRLAQAHAYWMRKGYCPPEDKKRLTKMHDMYTARGLNTLEKSYNDDLLRLPDEPPKGKVALS